MVTSDQRRRRSGGDIQTTTRTASSVAVMERAAQGQTSQNDEDNIPSSVPVSRRRASTLRSSSVSRQKRVLVKEVEEQDTPAHQDDEEYPETETLEEGTNPEAYADDVSTDEEEVVTVDTSTPSDKQAPRFVPRTSSPKTFTGYEVDVPKRVASGNRQTPTRTTSLTGGSSRSSQLQHPRQTDSSYLPKTRPLDSSRASSFPSVFSQQQHPMSIGTILLMTLILVGSILGYLLHRTWNGYVWIWKRHWATKLALLVVTPIALWMLGGALIQGGVNVVHSGDNLKNALEHTIRPTAQSDAFLGMNDSVAHPSHIEAQIIHHHLQVVVTPGNNAVETKVLVSPQPLSSSWSDDVPIQISVQPGTRHNTIVVQIGDSITGLHRVLIVNNGQTFTFESA